MGRAGNDFVGEEPDAKHAVGGDEARGLVARFPLHAEEVLPRGEPLAARHHRARPRQRAPVLVDRRVHRASPGHVPEVLCDGHHDVACRDEALLAHLVVREPHVPLALLLTQRRDGRLAARLPAPTSVQRRDPTAWPRPPAIPRLGGGENRLLERFAVYQVALACLRVLISRRPPHLYGGVGEIVQNDLAGGRWVGDKVDHISESLPIPSHYGTRSCWPRETARRLAVNPTVRLVCPRCRADAPDLVHGHPRLQFLALLALLLPCRLLRASSLFAHPFPPGPPAEPLLLSKLPKEVASVKPLTPVEDSSQQISAVSTPAPLAEWLRPRA